jgi:hypothetical protein
MSILRGARVVTEGVSRACSASDGLAEVVEEGVVAVARHFGAEVIRHLRDHSVSRRSKNKGLQA